MLSAGRKPGFLPEAEGSTTGILKLNLRTENPPTKCVLCVLMEVDVGAEVPFQQLGCVSAVAA